MLFSLLCLSVCVFVCVCVSVCLSVCLPVCLSVAMHMCVLHSLSFLFICLAIFFFRSLFLNFSLVRVCVCACMYGGRGGGGEGAVCPWPCICVCVLHSLSFLFICPFLFFGLFFSVFPLLYLHFDLTPICLSHSLPSLCPCFSFFLSCLSLCAPPPPPPSLSDSLSLLLYILCRGTCVLFDIVVSQILTTFCDWSTSGLISIMCKYFTWLKENYCILSGLRVVLNESPDGVLLCYS